MQKIPGLVLKMIKIQRRKIVTLALNILKILGATLLPYLLGSVSFPILVARLFGTKDIREHGSGNAGGTNVLRVVGKRAAAMALLLDILKCVAAIAFVKYILFNGAQYSGIAQCAAGLFCMLGHMFPVFFKFKGGKGVACAGGFMLIYNFWAAMILLTIFLAVSAISRYVSLGSIIAAAAMAPAVYFMTGGNLLEAILAGLLGLAIIFMHRGNIVRLAKGQERKFGAKKESNSEEPEIKKG